jgi:recombination protein RecA
MDIKKAKSQVLSRFGEGSIMTIGDRPKTLADKILCPMGFPGFERAMGIPGLPRNRMIEIYGPESSGKTTLALHMVRSVQEAGGSAAFIDVENAIDVEYARDGIGVDTDTLLISQPDYGEQAIDIVVELLSIQKGCKEPFIVVIDSVDSLVPKKELDGDFDDGEEMDQETGKMVKKKSGGGMGLRARLMSRACRQITQHLKGSNSLVVFINQIRMKIGVVYGNPETTSGGNALKFYASMRFDIRNVGQYKENEKVVGNNFRVKVVKNKLAPPFREYVGLNVHGQGVQQEWDTYSVLMEKNLLKRKGSWYSIEGTEYKFQGFKGFKKIMTDTKSYQEILTLCNNP